MLMSRRSRLPSALPVLVVMALLAPIGAAAPAGAAPGPEYVGQIGQPGRAGVYAWGMATAANGNLLVGDYWNYRVIEYTPAGELVNAFGEQGTQRDSQNNAPHGLAVNPLDGDIYVSDLNNADIDRHAADGTFIESLITYAYDPDTGEYLTDPIPYAPRLAFDADGVSYMVNSHTFPSAEEFVHRIIIRDAEWNVVGHIGDRAAGGGSADFGVLRGVTVDADGVVYVVDAGRGVVHRYAKDGSTPAPYDYVSVGDFGGGRFGGDVRGIVVDDDNGWVYVVDTANFEVDKFTTGGRYLDSFGSRGTGPGQFRDGGRELTLIDDPRTSSASAPRLVAVADFSNNRVNVYDSDGAFAYDIPNPPLPPIDSGFNQLQDVALSPDGAFVYTADTYNHRMQKFDVGTGEVVEVWGYRGSSPEPYAMNYNRGVGVDPGNGDVWLSNTREGDIKVYDADGDFLSSFGDWGDGPLEFDYSRGIEVAPGADGLVYIPDGGNERIQITDKSGELQRTVPCGVGAGGITLKGCVDIALAPGGGWWASSPQEGRVYRFDASGRVIDTISGLVGPHGLATHGDQLYVAESWAHRISVYDSNGQRIERFASRGTGPGQLDAPKGIDIRGDVLVVADSKNDRIQVWRLASTGGGADTAEPEISVVAPRDGAAVEGPGVAIDLEATDDVGVTGVSVAVQDRTARRWLQADGSFGSFTLLPATRASGDRWTIDIDLASGDYGIASRAFDASGKTGQGAWSAFVVGAQDTTAPTVSTDDATASQVTGTVTDDGTVTSVRVAVQDLASRQWLQPDGQSYGGWHTEPADLDGSSWSRAFTPSLPAGSYGVIALATDAAGNQARATWTTFTVG